MGHRSSELMGVIPRFNHDLFRFVDGLSKNIDMAIEVTFMELYNEQLVDLMDSSPIQRDPSTGALLNRDKLHIKEDGTGVNVGGLVAVPVSHQHSRFTRSF